MWKRSCKKWGSCCRRRRRSRPGSCCPSRGCGCAGAEPTSPATDTQPRWLVGGPSGQGGGGGLRGGGIRGGASYRVRDAREPQARARRPEPGGGVAEGFRDGQLRGGLRPSTQRHKRVLRPDPGVVRPRSGGPLSLFGGHGGAAFGDAGGDRGRGRDTRRLAAGRQGGPTRKETER